MDPSSKVVSPLDLIELADILAEAAHLRQVVVAQGGSSKATWGSRVVLPHLKIDTSKLSRVDHAKDDQTVVVGAGKNFQQLQQELALSGQRISLDPPDVEGKATVGGIMATGDYGPLRFRFGSPRELVLGMRAGFANGTVAHSGGRVIKNVAGYDLAKLMLGSFGTLGVIGEVAFRLHPLPEKRATVVVEARPEQATDLTLKILGSVIEPNAIEYYEGTLAILIEGTEKGANSQVQKLIKLIEGESISNQPKTFEESSSASIWGELAIQRAKGGHVCARIVTRVSQLGEIHQIANKIEGEVKISVISHAGSGVHDLVFSGDANIDAYGAALADLRRSFKHLPYPLSVRSAIDPLSGLVDLLGSPAPASLKVMQNIKRSLDPENLMARGRFQPWW